MPCLNALCWKRVLPIGASRAEREIMSISENELTHHVLGQAADWYALLCSGEASDRDQHNWQQWLNAHRDHRRSWQFVETVGERFESIDASPQQTEHTLQRARSQRLDRSKINRRNLLTSAALLVGGGSLGWATWQQTSLPTMLAAWNAQYTTSTGEIKDVLLADGTHVWINTASAFDATIDASHHHINLLSGEILIETSKVPSDLPLLVDTAYGQLRPLGTRFTVYKHDNGIQLSVFEGAVEITPHNASPMVIQAGEKTYFTAQKIQPPQMVSLSHEAWSRGLLLAEDISLQELINELSRYRRGYISVAPEVAPLKVFGGYPLNNPDEVLAMLEQVLPIKVNKTLPWWVSVDAIQY